jgi:hypothetical protein
MGFDIYTESDVPSVINTNAGSNKVDISEWNVADVDDEDDIAATNDDNDMPDLAELQAAEDLIKLMSKCMAQFWTIADMRVMRQQFKPSVDRWVDNHGFLSLKI